jgi:hypothetical protein
MNKLNKKLCDEWNSNKNINPITKRSIKENGPVYNNIEKNCNKIDGTDVKIANKKTGKKGIINICEQWLNNPNVNPETGKSIKKNGPVYKRLLKLCEEKKSKTRSSSSSSVSSKTLKLCDEWKKNKTINPETGYKIKENGPKYNYFKELCMNLNKKVKSSSSSHHSFHSPKSSMSSSHRSFHSPKLSSFSSSHHSFHTPKSSSVSNMSNRELLELFRENQELKQTIKDKFEKINKLSSKSNSSSSNSSSYYSSSSKHSSLIDPIFAKKTSEQERLENEIVDEIRSNIPSSTSSSSKKEENKEIIRNGFLDRLAYLIGF